VIATPTASGVLVARDDVPSRHIQSNVHASEVTRDHTIVWDVRDSIPGNKDWLEIVRPGDFIQVFPMARFSGWCNYVEHVEVDVYCAV